MSKYPSRQIMYDYLNNKSNAKRRGVEFHLTFEEWWHLWQSKYHLRGRGKGKYQLCRKGDKGPYSFSNCYVDLHENNRKIQKSWNKKIHNHDEIVELRKDYTTAEIAKMFDVSQHRIQEILRQKNRAPQLTPYSSQINYRE